MLILRRLVISHLRLVIPKEKYLSAVQSDSAIIDQMKSMNDENKFDQVLQLFDTYNKKNKSSSLPNRKVTQALKACLFKQVILNVPQIFIIVFHHPFKVIDISYFL